jgi:predicted 3-demethylubiquinone-9 3-methyltransferase (glyoxalase superfamily)
MPALTGKITPFLWFDAHAEDAARSYTAIFPDSHIGKISRYGAAGREVHGREAGSVMTVEFELAGQAFIALNGGPLFKFNEAVSFHVACDTQDEIDHFWSKLSDGGEEGRCGWLKDKYGLSWQVVPTRLPQLLAASGSDKTMAALLRMGKLDIAALERARGA